MRDFAQRLMKHPEISSMVAHHRALPARDARWGSPADPLPASLDGALRGLGIERLYRHQAEALDAARAGRNILAVTPTASGKTLVFALPVLENLLKEPGARALFLYPTKALAQDQLSALRQLARLASPLSPPTFEIYDGDTPAHVRRRIRKDPPEVLLTNPDMLHLGLLAHHHDWAPFLHSLRWVVLDELHVYRGLFGTHVHHVLGRLRRLCAEGGARPTIIAASATIGNPEEFAGRLTGLDFEVVSESGAPRAGRNVVFLNPVTVSPYTAALRVVAEAAGRGRRTIAFTKARKITELLHAWLARQNPELAKRVAPYRAGYLPEERRAIERRLFDGDLLAVLTTSALELGIDVGDLDVCVLVGYPGSLMSSWQRIGRVGRAGRDATVVLIAMPDALDQYVVAHPEMFFGDAFEPAVLDPGNPVVAGRHLECAAAEAPLDQAEAEEGGGAGREFTDRLVQEGRLVLDASGRRWYSFRRRPHRDVHLRSAGEPFAIVDSSGRLLGTIDGMRVYHECHPEAVYLHGGRSYRVTALDDERRRVTVVPHRGDYYTAVLGEKETRILERLEAGRVGAVSSGIGRLEITVRVRGYQKKRLFGGETLSEHPLTAPPLVFETVGMWIEMPDHWPASVTAAGGHFMGGIHAAEHAMIGLFPLLAIADRGDVGGISYTRHPQIEGPAVFVYDSAPGGAGLAERGFRDLEMLVRRTMEHVSKCGCDDGCPACIQSPKCGNGNKPLDKTACTRVLRAVLGEEEIPPIDPETAVPEERGGTAPGRGRHGIRRKIPDAIPGGAPRDLPEPAPRVVAESDRHVAEERAADSRRADPPRSDGDEGQVLVFDLETRRSADEVGGWGRASEMGLALAVVWDRRDGVYRTYFENDVQTLLLDLAMADRVVGFNIDRFDLKVLSGYTDRDLGRIRTCDMLAEIHRRLGFRLSLNHLAEVNLGLSKSADGLQSLQWWKEGRIDLIEEYCRRDVEVTAQLYDRGKRDGFLLYRDHSDRTVRVPVRW